MYIPDPIERMEARIESQIDLVDADGNYPCCYCGKRVPVGELIAISTSPDAPGMCFDCADAENERNACKA